MKYGEWTLGQTEALINKCGGEDRAKRFLAGELVLVDNSKKVADVTLDTIVRVDRSIRPAYPEWVKDVLHPELELSGPAEFDLAKVESWLHDGQKNGKWVRGDKLYAHLKSNEMLDSCFSLADALAIQAKGVTVFPEYFKGKAPFFWKSVVRGRGGDLRVPYLYEDGGQVELEWYWLGYGFHDDHPALRFASQN